MSPSPGPTLDIEVAAADIEVIKSNPFKDNNAVIIKKISQVFVAGPPVVNRLGETVTKESLGGSDIHGKNGVIDDVADSEAEALAMAKKFLSYLPSSTYELANQIKNNDPVDRKDEWLIEAIPKNRRLSYEIRPIIETLVDKNTFFETFGLFNQIR